jgi:hypothetical protein
MMIFVTYQEMKRLHDSKVRRSLELYQAERKAEPVVHEADIVELVFGASCDHEEQIGA